jgi:hypothetical protein
MTPSNEQLRSTLVSIRLHPGTAGPTGDFHWEQGLLAIAAAMIRANIMVQPSGRTLDADERASLMAVLQAVEAPPDGTALDEN